VVELADQGKTVTFRRQKVWPLSGKVLGATEITVRQNWVTPDTPLLDEEAEANRFRGVEEQGMIEQGVKPGLYRLKDVQRDVVTLDGRRYYLLRYKTVIPRPGLDLIGESVLYVHFPADFGERRIFYVFHVADFKEEYSLVSIDTSQIEPVVRSFRLKR
jgi:hypothetical protein